jgi:CRISPR-associated protein Csb1
MTTAETTGPVDATASILDEWATDMAGPVALHLKQKLVPIEGEGGVIFPPTYADIGYNVDTLSDGTRVATIDSVGSQANRLEPIFKSDSKNPNEWLVPQIEIVIRKDGDHEVRRSLLDLAHRAADAVVQSSPELLELIGPAFKALQQGDAGPLCEIAPTSLVFGVWDSRGDTGEKRPRLVRSTVRAWDVQPLHTAAQFNSVWKLLDEQQQEELEKEATAKKVKLSTKGFADAPATFRKTKAPQYRDGSPNPEARVLGGVLVSGRIERDVTVNLVALRGLRGANDDKTTAIRKYLLGLSLMAATADIELFLREGCLLRYAENGDAWYKVPRRGEPTRAVLSPATVEKYAITAAGNFRKRWPEKFGEKWPTLKYEFDLAEAKKLLAKKTEEEEAGESS